LRPPARRPISGAHYSHPRFPAAIPPSMTIHTPSAQTELPQWSLTDLLRRPRGSAHRAGPRRRPRGQRRPDRAQGQAGRGAGRSPAPGRAAGSRREPLRGSDQQAVGGRRLRRSDDLDLPGRSGLGQVRGDMRAQSSAIAAESPVLHPGAQSARRGEIEAALRADPAAARWRPWLRRVRLMRAARAVRRPGAAAGRPRAGRRQLDRLYDETLSRWRCLSAAKA
jgi:hypothetical protein